MPTSNATADFQQPHDFLEESNELYALIKNLSEEDFEQRTAFKNWSINDVIQHLHVWNIAADLSLNDPTGFDEFFALVAEAFRNGKTLKEFERQYFNIKGLILLELWKSGFKQIANNFENANPKARVKWAGPDMSVRSLRLRHA